MNNIKHILSLLMLLLLTTVSSCKQQHVGFPDIEGEGQKVRLRAFAPQTPSLKALLKEQEGVTDLLSARFKEGDKVSLFVVQEKVATAIGSIPFSELAQDGKSAILEFKLPESVEATKPMTLVGYSGIYQEEIINKEGTLVVPVLPYSGTVMEEFNIPVAFKMENFVTSGEATQEADAHFQHIGSYEVINLHNTSKSKFAASALSLIDAKTTGATKSWTLSANKEGADEMVPVYNLLDGTTSMQKSSKSYVVLGKSEILPGATAKVLSWYIPKNEARPSMQLHVATAAKNIKSMEIIPANEEPMVPGKAYYVWAKWDGSNITITDKDGEAKPYPYIKVVTTIEKGKKINASANVDYSTGYLSYVDLNGNHTAEEGESTEGIAGGKDYTVSQPEITFTGSFKSLTLDGQQLTSALVGPLAIPTDLNFNNNLLTKEALDALFESLPDITDIPESDEVKKMIYVINNPGSLTCDIKIATDKGWKVVKSIDSRMIALNIRSLTLEVGESYTYIVTRAPENITDKTLTWTTSDASVATIDQNGMVTGVSVGEATITVTTSNGISFSTKVTVVKKSIPVESISITPKTKEMVEDDVFKFTVGFDPINASNKTVTWKSSNEAVAKVDEAGNVTAIKAGTTKIIAESINGKKAEAFVTVKPKTIEAIDITIEGLTDVNLYVGENHTFNVKFNPTNTTNQNVTWSSSAVTVATVDNNGKVTAVSEGTTIITAKSANGKTATAKVTVKARSIDATSIKIKEGNQELVVEEVFNFHVEFTPTNTTNKNLTWTSSDTSVATVDNSGKVTALKVGTTTITAKSANGKEDTVTVTVKAKSIPANSIALNVLEKEIKVGDKYTFSITWSPGDTTDRTVTWSSSDPTVASIDQKGVVTGLKVGTTIIKAVTTNGKEATATLTVKTPSVIPDVPGEEA